MLYLKTANMEDLEKEYLFVRDMPIDENGFTNEWHGISKENFEQKALPAMIAYSKGEQLPDGYVPETFLFLWNDNEIVGQFSHMSDELKKLVNEITEAINGIATAVDESTHAVTTAANNTNELVKEIEGIRTQMEYNQNVAQKLKSETERFTNV